MLSTKAIDEFIEGDWTVAGDDDTRSGYWDLEDVTDNGRLDIATWTRSEPTPVEIMRLGKVTFVESFGGEGQGDRMHLVFRLDTVDGSSRLFKKDGYYSSYGGSEYDAELQEVKATEKTVTVYE